MAATTAYTTSNNVFHSHSFTSTRTQFSSISHRTSPLSSPSSPMSDDNRLSITRTIKSDENNNEQMIEDPDISPSDNDVLYIAMDNDIDDSEEDDPIINNDIDEEQVLAFVGLRRKTKKPIVTKVTLLPLTKRLACPVCLLPLPKYSQRVRQALYIRLPFLKFLRITIDIEQYCSTDENARANSLLPRLATQTRNSSVKNRSPRKRKLPKTEFVSMAASACRPSTSKIVINKYVQSALKCNVVLDRLEQSSIDQIMRDSTANDDNDEECTSNFSTSQRTIRKTSPNARRSLKTSQNQPSATTVTTTTTVEKTVVKRKLTMTTTTTDMSTSKRFKSVEENPPAINNNNGEKNDSSSSMYKRIYLKCFVCSKRQIVDATETNSDALHSHWLEHDGDLSLNIYDSEIDSILTRVVEFFNLPRQHLLEGKIKRVFIYNSKEIRSTSTTTLSSNDSYIVID